MDFNKNVQQSETKMHYREISLRRIFASINFINTNHLSAQKIEEKIVERNSLTFLFIVL